VRRRIVTGVGLSLDNPASDPIDKENDSNQIAGDRYRIAREVRLGQRCCHAPVSVTS
jgi:hypothetical protein